MDAAQVSQLIQDEIRKVAVSTSTYTFNPGSRSIYSPENLDPVVRVLVPTSTPVRGELPRDPGMGEAAEFNMITSRLDPAAGGTGTRVGFADAGQPNQTQQATAFKAFKYKLLGRDVEIGRNAIAANRGSNLEDLRAKQETIKTLEVLLGEENLILNGDATAEPLEFDGLNKLIVTNSGTAAFVTASGVSAYGTTLYNNGADLLTHFIANPRQMNALSDQLQQGASVYRIVETNQTSVTVGSHMQGIVDGNTGNILKTVASRYAGSWGYILSQQSAAGETYIAMEDLESISIYDVPTSNHSVQSRVYESTVLKLIGEYFQYKVGGLAQ